MVQEYVKLLELFEIAKKVAGLQMADYATHREGLVRVLYSEPGLGAAQVTERYSADGLPYLAGGDAPDGYAMVTFSTTTSIACDTATRGSSTTSAGG
jgi:hypothetical protein